MIGPRGPPLPACSEIDSLDESPAPASVVDAAPIAAVLRNVRRFMWIPFRLLWTLNNLALRRLKPAPTILSDFVLCKLREGAFPTVEVFRSAQLDAGSIASE